MVTLEAIALVPCFIGLIGTILSGHLQNTSNLGNERWIMALTAIGILVLAIVTYLRALKISTQKRRKVSGAIKIAWLPVALIVAGVGMLIVPVLFAPAFAPTLWLALLIVTSLLSMALILNPKTRRHFIE